MAPTGYARASTLDQGAALQRDALARHGVHVEFVGTGSGVGPRPELQKALASLVSGDTLVVWKLDRVARSLIDLLGIQSRLKSVGASIRSLTEPLDTTSPFGEFTFQVLGPFVGGLMALVGYARVSTLDQGTALQRDALARHGAHVVFVESGSGVGPRPELQKALVSLVSGDTLVVWKLDRVARSQTDSQGIQSRLKSVGAPIRSLIEPLDTPSPFGEFTFQVLGAVVISITRAGVIVKFYCIKVPSVVYLPR